MRKPVIGVMGGSDVPEPVLDTARELGQYIARRGWILLNGGRDAGVMAASAEGARAEGGMVIGILPDSDDRRASPNLDVAVMTGMGDARNLINVLSSDVVIACPGALGTMSEIVLALLHDRPVILLQHDVGEEITKLATPGRLHRADSPLQAVEIVKCILDDR